MCCQQSLSARGKQGKGLSARKILRLQNVAHKGINVGKLSQARSGNTQIVRKLLDTTQILAILALGCKEC